MQDFSTFTNLFIIFVLILANGIFAMTEMAIVSARKMRLKKKAETGDKGAAIAYQLANEPTDMLSTIQVGITLIGIVMGAFGGESLSKSLANVLEHVPGLSSYAGMISFIIVIFLLTFVSIILGELVPKRAALGNPEKIAARLARPMLFFSKLSKPVVALLSITTNATIKLFGIKKSNAPAITEEEVRLLIDQGTKIGLFEKVEQEMVEHIFELGDVTAESLMTPRTQLEWIDLEDSQEVNVKKIMESTYSRFPVGKGSLDDFKGILYTKDLLRNVLHDGKPNIEATVRDALVVPASMKIYQVLELFKKSMVHEAFVLDEYGGIDGYISLHDILEEIVGDLPTDGDGDKPGIIARDESSWLIDGLLRIDDFIEFFEINELPEEEEDLYQTVGGFVVHHLGVIPQPTDFFEWNGYRFEVVDMDRARVDKVLLTKLPDDEIADK